MRVHAEDGISAVATETPFPQNTSGGRLTLSLDQPEDALRTNSDLIWPHVMRHEDSDKDNNETDDNDDLLELLCTIKQRATNSVSTQVLFQVARITLPTSWAIQYPRLILIKVWSQLSGSSIKKLCYSE